jgi:taurine dioxygenase
MFSVRPSGEALGAEIRGVDLARDVDDATSESVALLEELFAQVVKPQVIYPHRWQIGDFLIWDNCAVQHKAVFDYRLPERRLMERTTVCGTVPVH